MTFASRTCFSICKRIELLPSDTMPIKSCDTLQPHTFQIQSKTLIVRWNSDRVPMAQHYLWSLQCGRGRWKRGSRRNLSPIPHPSYPSTQYGTQQFIILLLSIGGVGLPTSISLSNTSAHTLNAKLISSGAPLRQLTVVFSDCKRHWRFSNDAQVQHILQASALV